MSGTKVSEEERVDHCERLRESDDAFDLDVSDITVGTVSIDDMSNTSDITCGPVSTNYMSDIPDVQRTE